MSINFETNWLSSVTPYDKNLSQRLKSPDKAGESVGAAQESVADPEKDGGRGRAPVDYLSEGIYGLFHPDKEEFGSMQKLGNKDTASGSKLPVPGQTVNYVEGEEG